MARTGPGNVREDQVVRSAEKYSLTENETILGWEKS